MDLVHHIKEGYFKDKSYALIYIHYLFHNIAHAVMYVFTGAYFLKLGMPLPIVLLFYGLEFGIRGLLCPWGFSFLNKVGLMPGLVVSTIFYILFFVGIAFAHGNLFIGFSSLLLSSLSGAIYYPFIDVIGALYIKEDHNRAKQMSLGIILGSMGKIIGAAGVGFVLAHYGFGCVLGIIVITLLLSLIPFIPLHESFKSAANITPSRVYGFLLSQDFRPFLKPLFGEQLMIIVRAVMIPIFLYTVVNRIDNLGYLIALTIILEQICTLIAGHYTDKQGIKSTLRFSNVAYPLSMLGYIFLAKTPLSLLFLESYHKITNNIFTSSFRSGIHNYIRREHPQDIMLFGTGYQMVLCFGELIALPLYALLACFMGINVFYLACAMAIVGLWMSTNYFTKEKNKATLQG